MIFNKFKPTEKESEIISIISLMCTSGATEIQINPKNFDCFLVNEDKHYTIVITGNSVVISNTNTFTRESFSDKMVDTLRDIVYNRAHSDREYLKSKILLREHQLLQIIKQSFETENEDNEKHQNI